MSNSTWTNLPVALALLAPLASTGAFADWRPQQGPCEKTARQMQQACRHDTWDDHAVATGQCLNIADPAERVQCHLDAAADKREGLDLCSDQYAARIETCDLLGEDRYDPDPLLDPALRFVDPDAVGPADANPYVSIIAGHTHVLSEGDEIIVVTVTDETKQINGVPCRVVVDAVVTEERDGPSVDYEPVEVTDDWFAQDSDANVYYCGELSRNYEDGDLSDLDGSFRAGVDGAKAGLLIMAAPPAGLAHRQEFALGEAEDVIQYLDLAALPLVENPAFPCAAAGGCVQTHDTTPLEPDRAEYKYYRAGVGMVRAEALEEGVPTGETAELVCVGDSLDVLRDPACAIADPDALFARLCALAPEAFCTAVEDR